MPLLIIALLAFLLLGKKNDGSQYGTVDANGGFTPPKPKSPTKNPDGSTTIYPTISEGKAQSIAAEILDELNSVFIKDDNHIMNLMLGLNEADYLLVYKAFGKHGLHAADTFGINQHDLTYWLVDTLDHDNMMDARKRWPHIFAVY